MGHANVSGRGGWLLLLISLSILLAGCGGTEQAPDPEARKLLVIGIDSADWRILDPMLEEGACPI